MCYYHCTRYETIEGTNLSEVGGDLDKHCKQVAADLESNWEGAGNEVGIEIWSIDTWVTTKKRINLNKRIAKEKLHTFNVFRYPKFKHGQFHNGDCYVILETTKVADTFLWNVYFWIGSATKLEMRAVAAYKANELSAFLGGMALQHREVEGGESDEFLDCFESITYAEGKCLRGEFEKVDEQSFWEKMFALCSPCW